MKIYLINIGDELLIGQVVNTLAADIAMRLDNLGITLTQVEVVGDSAAAIAGAVGRGLQSDADAVITTGGLGPTRDDITKRVLTDIFGGTLQPDAATLANVAEVVARRGLRLNDLTRAQALVPTSCRVIQNRVGTAPVMWFEHDNKVVVSMPGVPFETLTMLDEKVLPQLLERFTPTDACVHETLIVTGYTESALAQELAPVEDTLPGYLHLAYLPRPGIVRLRLDGHHHDATFISQQAKHYASIIATRLGDAVKARCDMTEAEILLDVCRRRGLTLASAESCTGGNIAHTITAIAGCSDVYTGSIVAYSNQVKTHLLGVDPEVIAANGVVSEPVVAQMALGACQALGTDIAIATSGIAGPTGATPGKSVGTVCIAVATRQGKTVTATRHFPGNRQRVIERATSTALIMAIDSVTGATYTLHGYK